jgi:RNA 3'-terminal phosphate cyclase
MRGVKVIPALVLVVSLLAPAQSTGGKGDETKIIALENAWNLAEVHKDGKVLDELLADTLVYVDYDGSFMNKAQFLATTRDTAYRPEQIVNQEVTVHIYDNTAVVTGIYRDKGVDKGRTYVRRGRFTIPGSTTMGFGRA